MKGYSTFILREERCGGLYPILQEVRVEIYEGIHVKCPNIFMILTKFETDNFS